MKVKFRHWDCVVEFAKYRNGRTAICLVDERDDESVATASVNIEACSDDQWESFADELNVDPNRLVFIKDYSENEGMLDALVSQGVVENTDIRIETGFVTVPLCIIREEVMIC